VPNTGVAGQGNDIFDHLEFDLVGLSLDDAAIVQPVAPGRRAAEKFDQRDTAVLLVYDALVGIDQHGAALDGDVVAEAGYARAQIVLVGVGVDDDRWLDCCCVDRVFDSLIDNLGSRFLARFLAA